MRLCSGVDSAFLKNLLCAQPRAFEVKPRISETLAMQGAQGTVPSCTSLEPPTPPYDLSLLCPPTPLTPPACWISERHVCGYEMEPQHSVTRGKQVSVHAWSRPSLGTRGRESRPVCQAARPLLPHPESSDVPLRGGRGCVGVKDSQTRFCCQLETDEGSIHCS